MWRHMTRRNVELDASGTAALTGAVCIAAASVVTVLTVRNGPTPTMHVRFIHDMVLCCGCTEL